MGGMCESGTSSSNPETSSKLFAKPKENLMFIQIILISGHVSSPLIKVILLFVNLRLFWMAKIATGWHVAESNITGTLLIAIKQPPIRLPYNG